MVAAIRSHVAGQAEVVSRDVRPLRDGWSDELVEQFGDGLGPASRALPLA